MAITHAIFVRLGVTERQLVKSTEKFHSNMWVKNIQSA